MLVLQTRLPIFEQFRTPIERAFIGETVIQIPIDTRTGGPAGPTTFPFKQSGDFSRKWRVGDPTTPQYAPRYTRVGAALFLNDYDDGPEMKHRALIRSQPKRGRLPPGGYLVRHSGVLLPVGAMAMVGSGGTECRSQDGIRFGHPPSGI